MENLFFELIQVALGERDRLSQNPTSEEWRSLYAMAEKQTMFGVCFQGIEFLHGQKQTPPQNLLFEWIAMTEYIKKKNESLDKQCIRLQTILQEAGIRSSILKGQGIARYYGELAQLRQPGDIDIYVDCGRKRALQFAYDIGQKEVSWDYKHLHLDIFKDTEVEVHYRVEVLLNLWKNRKLQQWFKNHEEKLFSENGNFVTPTIEFNRFYILLHIYRHFLYEGIGLRQLLDYYFVLKANTNLINLTYLKDLLKEYGMWKFARGIMWVLQEVFGMEKEYMICEPLESEGKFILSEVMEGGNFGHHDMRIEYSQDGKLQTVKKIVKHNRHLIRHYPSEVIWPPIWFVWHKCWKWSR